MSSNTADCSGSGCVGAIDLGHLIRKPSDRLLTSNGESINPFQNILLLFALFCSSSPGQARRGGTALKHSCLLRNSLLFFLECVILWNTIKNSWRTLRHALLSLKVKEKDCFSTIQKIWFVRGYKVFIWRQLYTGSRFNRENYFALQQFTGFWSEQVVLFQMFTTVMRNSSSENHLAWGVPEEIYRIGH